MGQKVEINERGGRGLAGAGLGWPGLAGGNTALATDMTPC